MVTTLFYHLLAPEGGHPTWEENFIEKKTQNARFFFLSHTSNLINKSSHMLFQKVQQNIYQPSKYEYFPKFYYWPITKHFSTSILCWVSTHLLSQSVLFLQVPVCDLKWILFCCLCYAFFLFSLPCDHSHPLENGWLHSFLVYCVFLYFCHFPIRCLGSGVVFDWTYSRSLHSSLIYSERHIIPPIKPSSFNWNWLGQFRWIRPQIYIEDLL